MSQRRKPASAVGQARSAAGAGVNSPAPATGSQPGNAIKVPYDAVVVGKAYLVEPKFRQANDDIVFLVLAKPPLPEAYNREQDPEERARIEGEVLIKGVWFYRQNETACGVHRLSPEVLKPRRARDQARNPGGLPFDPDDNRVFVDLPEGMEWNRRRLFLCSDRLRMWGNSVELGALIRPVKVQYKRPGEPAPACGDDEYFFSQMYGEDHATYIDYYPEAPPKAEGEEAEMLEHLRQLFGTTDGAGPCSARVAPGVDGLNASAGPSRGPPAQPQPSPFKQSSIISGDEGTGGQEGDVGQGPAGSKDGEEDEDNEEDEEVEGNNDDDDFVQVPRPGPCSSGAAAGSGGGGATGPSAAAGVLGPRVLRSGTGPKAGQAPSTARALVSPTLQSPVKQSPKQQQQQQQQRPQGRGARSKGRSGEQLLALPELGLLAGGEEAGKAATRIHLVPHRTALGRVPEDPLVVDGVQLQRADDPARRRLRKGDKLVMHVCCGMGGASLHGRVNVQEERRKAVVERRKLRERRRTLDGGRRGEGEGEGGVGGSSGGAGPCGQDAGPGGSGEGAGPSGSGAGVAATDGSKAASAASGGGKGAGGSSRDGGGGAGKRVEQRGTAGHAEAEDASDERPCKRRGGARGLSGRHAGAAAPSQGAAALGAGPSEAAAGSAPTAGPQAPRTGGAGSGDGGGGDGDGGSGSDEGGDAGPSTSVKYSGLVTAGRKRNRADAGAAAAAAAAAEDVLLDSVMRRIETDDYGCIRLVNGFACDVSRPAMLTFLSNNPAVGVLCRATELLVLLQLFDKLVRWAQPVGPAFEAAEAARAASGCGPSPVRGKAAEGKEQRQQGAKAGVGKAPQEAKSRAGGKGECAVADVLGMRLCHGVPVDEHEQLELGKRELAAGDCWLEFLVEREYAEGCAEDSRGRYEWVQLEELGGCTELLARFVLRLKAERLLPLPGDVFCLVAGPPCQHITGLNHKANNIKVMKDSTNRIVLSVLRIVEHLRPPFTLLEQVLDASKREDGVWLRTVQYIYNELEYQQRTGVPYAGSFAAAEARRRLFVWAADTGYVLPAFPRPTHEKNHLPDSHLDMRSVLEYWYVVAGSDAKLLPGSVLGDVMQGVESVDNWCMAPLARTRGCPRTVLQHLLSRPPPDSTCSTEERAATYLGLTAPVQLELALALLEARDAFMHQTDKLLQTEEGRRALLEEARAALAEQLAVRGRAGRGGRPHAGGTGGDLTEADLQKHIDDMAAIHVARMVLAANRGDNGPAEEYIGKGARSSGASEAGEDEEDGWEEGDEEYEGNVFMVGNTMDMAHRDLGVRLLSNAQRAVVDMRRLAGPALEHLRTMRAACDGRSEVGAAGQAATAAAAAAGAQWQGGGAAGRGVTGTAASKSRDAGAAAGGAGAAPGGSGSGRSGGGDGSGGGGGGGDNAGLLRQLLQGRVTNHIPAMLTPREEHRVMCVPPNHDDPTRGRPTFQQMRGPICDNCTALGEPIMAKSTRKSKPKCVSKKPYSRWGRREAVHTFNGDCKPSRACVLHPDKHRTLTMRERMSGHGFPFHYVAVADVLDSFREDGYRGLVSRRDGVLGPGIEALAQAQRALEVGEPAGASGSGAAATKAAGATRLRKALRQLPRLGEKMQQQIGNSVCPLVAEGLSRELLRAASLAVEDGGRSGLGPEWSAGLGACSAVREAWEWRCERPEERMGGRERSNWEGLVDGGEGEEEDQVRRLEARVKADAVGQGEVDGELEDGEGQEDEGEEEDEEEEDSGFADEDEDEEGQEEDEGEGEGGGQGGEGEEEEGEEVGDN